MSEAAAGGAAARPGPRSARCLETPLREEAVPCFAGLVFLQAIISPGGKKQSLEERTGTPNAVAGS